MQAGAGLRIRETLAFATECRRTDIIRVRWQVSSKANRGDCRTWFEENDAHTEQWDAVPVAFKDKAGRDKELEVFFAPRERGKGTMPTATTYPYHFRMALKVAGLVRGDGKPKYTPHGLRHFFASTALANGIPIHEVSRWLGHKSIKTTVDTYGHLVPGAWHRCREIMQEAMRPVPVEVPTEAPQEADGYEEAV